MEDLLELRKNIDIIDNEIVELYERRMKISEQVAEYKIATGKKVFDKSREDSKLETLSQKASGEFTRHGILELFEQIMAMSRKKQYQLLTEHGICEKKILRVLMTLILQTQELFSRELREHIPSLQ